MSEEWPSVEERKREANGTTNLWVKQLVETLHKRIDEETKHCLALTEENRELRNKQRHCEKCYMNAVMAGRITQEYAERELKALGEEDRLRAENERLRCEIKALKATIETYFVGEKVSE